MDNTRYKSGRGFTIIELVVTMTIILILAPLVGVLLVSGHRAWANTYSFAHKKVKQDAEAVTLAFGNTARRANRNPRDLRYPNLDYGYAIYDIDSGEFSVAKPEGTGREVVYGDAVEFIYWDAELDSEDSYGLMNASKIGTAYALFYIDGDKLKVDRGPYPPGAVPVDGGEKNSTGVTTTVLAENVSTDLATGAFSYTVDGYVPEGAVRIHITITDPEDDESIKVMTAGLMRNMWPR